MRKYSKIIAPLLALMLAFALAGCGEDAAATSGLAEVSPWEKNVLKVDAVDNWGAGLDIVMGAATGAIVFAAGDTITIKGVYIKGEPTQQMILNINHSGWAGLQGWNPVVGAGKTFEKEFTLTASDATDLAAVTGPTNIRIRSNKEATFVITDLIIVTGTGATKVTRDLSALLAAEDKGVITSAELKAMAPWLSEVGGTVYEIVGP